MASISEEASSLSGFPFSDASKWLSFFLNGHRLLAIGFIEHAEIDDCGVTCFFAPHCPLPSLRQCHRTRALAFVDKLCVRVSQFWIREALCPLC